MKKYLPLLAFLVLNLTAKADVPLDTIRVMTYNILDFPDAIGTQRVPSFRTILDQIQPDVLVVQEMKSSAGVTEFLNDVLNYSTPNLYSAVTFIDASYDSENSCFYKSSRVTFISQDTILTNLRAFSEYVFTTNTQQTQTLRIYSAHLKSSDGTANEQQRLAEVTILRDRLSLLPTGTEFLLVGDFNLYYGSEPAFLKLTQSETNNTGRMRDPINQVGNWSNNSSYQSIHTQSTRTVSQGSGGALGGLDDRFDFILTSYGMNDTQKIDYLSSTYTSFGNDGNHFNLQINSGTNSVVSQATADALVFASDHLPVFMDFIVYGIGDSLKPTISSVNATSQNTVTLTFSEDVNQTTALANSNYSVNNGIGNPTLVTLLTSNSVLLTLGQNLTTSTYTLTVNNVQDLAGNTILANSTANFSYTIPVVPVPNSVIINEYVVNDAGTTTYSTIGKTISGDWIELLVVQNGVDLRNWRLTDNNTKTLLNEGSIIFPDNTIFTNIPAETLILLLTTNNAANSANFPTDDTDFSDGKMLFYVGNGNLNTSLDSGFDVSNNNDSITLLDGNGTNSTTSDFADDFGIDFVAEGSTTTPTSFGIGAEVSFTGFFSGIDSNEGVYFTNDASSGFNNDNVSVGWAGNLNGTTTNLTPSGINEGQLLSTSNSKPTLLFASVTSATNIDIFFSENLDQTTTQNTSNYLIDGGIGNPVSAVLDATNNALVHLTVSTLADFGTYDLTVSNLKDLTNLTMVTTTVSIYFNANPAQTPVVITEFMRDPGAVNDSEGEFLELYNLAGVPVNINGWVLTDNAGETHTINNGSPLIILPNGFLILGLNGDVNSNGGISVDYVYSGFYLSNSGSGDQIILMNGSEIIDNVSFTTVSGFSNQTGKSNELIYFDGDNNVPENWQVSNSQLSSGDFASPKQKTHSVNLVVQIFGNDLILSWNAVSNATSYDVLEAGTETLVTNTANLTVTLVGEAINQSNKFYFVRAKQ